MNNKKRKCSTGKRNKSLRVEASMDTTFKLELISGLSIRRQKYAKK